MILALAIVLAQQIIYPPVGMTAVVDHPAVLVWSDGRTVYVDSPSRYRADGSVCYCFCTFGKIQEDHATRPVTVRVFQDHRTGEWGIGEWAFGLSGPAGDVGDPPMAGMGCRVKWGDWDGPVLAEVTIQ